MGASPAEGSRSISRIATEISEWSRPGAWTLREAGNGPVVTRSSSTLGMSFADESGAESGIAASVVPSRRSGASAKRRAAFAAVFLSLRRHDPDQVRRVAAPTFPGRRPLSPLSGHPLDSAIIRKLYPVRQGCGLMTEEAAPPAA